MQYEIFTESFIAAVVMACDKLCKDDVLVFKPKILEELGFDVSSQETSGMISLMFQMDKVEGFKLVKGKNGGIKRITSEGKKPKKEMSKSDRKCTNCGKVGTGHNARTCPEEAVTETQASDENIDIVPENNNSDWLVNSEGLDKTSEG